jgi:tRNA dimethylallyltransferase
MQKPPLVVIAGATASGKSALALDLAERRGGVVINADASQVYADLRVLSARPSAAEEARAPHRLYGVVDGAAACSAAGWAAMARDEVAAAHAAGRLPILVGGTGLYIRTLLDGIAPVPAIPDDIRAAVRDLDDPHAALAREDPVMAARLRPGDRQRAARALEVWRATHRSLADWQRDTVGGIGGEVELTGHVVEIARERLYARCDARFDAMLAGGALDEVAALVARGLPSDLPVMKALGVPPLRRHLAGEIDLASAAEIARRDTRHYAKRQLTWFRNQAPGWIRSAPDAPIP